jgi:ABC-type multidrug transport system ATPase subunit/pSer/pThr/pTyr-binding forkhead associated (FHA) protein
MNQSAQMRRITIGRNPQAGIVLNKQGVSWEHAQMYRDDLGRFILQDNGSTNGTFVNSINNRITAAYITPADTIYFGDLPVAGARLIESMQQASSERFSIGPGPAEVISFEGREILLGRSDKANPKLDHPTVSWEHARIILDNGRYSITDLNSTNGTYVDGVRVKGRVEIRAGQEIRLGTYALTLNEQGQIEKRSDEKDITVEVRDLTVAVPAPGGGSKVLIENVSLVIEPGELVALMGPSGAGKTTLLDAMNGMRPPASGHVLYAGRSLYQYFDYFRNRIGYVPQDDIMHTQLTVYEALYYTAKLRLPAGTKHEYIEKRIEEALRAVNLFETATAANPVPIQHRLIGYPGKKGVSGGQRKRVNVAMELLSDPTVLFLDEPTSGLSSTDARNVIKSLRELANKGKTIVVTIHQPGFDVYEKFHCLAMMSNHKDPALSDEQKAQTALPSGRLVYFGSAEGAFPFFEADKASSGNSTMRLPDDFFDGMHKRSLDYWSKKYFEDASSPRHRYVTKRQGNVADNQKRAGMERVVKHRLGQLMTLAARVALIKRKDAFQLWMMLLTPLVLGGLIVALHPVQNNTDFAQWSRFVSRVGSAHFLMVVAAIWFGCNNAVREIVGERAVLKRERMVNLSLLSYVGSKLLILSMICLLQCVLLLVIVHFGAGLKADFGLTLISLFLTSLAGTAIGLCVSAIAPTNETAVVSLPVILLPMIILGGGILPLHGLRGNVPALGYVADTLVPTRWAFETGMMLENDGRKLRFEGNTPADLAKALETCGMQLGRCRAGAPPAVEVTEKVRGDDLAENAFPSKEARHSYGFTVGVLAAMFGVLIGACLLILRRT